MDHLAPHSPSQARLAQTGYSSDPEAFSPQPIPGSEGGHSREASFRRRSTETHSELARLEVIAEAGAASQGTIWPMLDLTAQDHTTEQETMNTTKAAGVEILSLPITPAAKRDSRSSSSVSVIPAERNTPDSGPPESGPSTSGILSREADSTAKKSMLDLYPQSLGDVFTMAKAFGFTPTEIATGYEINWQGKKKNLHEISSSMLKNLKQSAVDTQLSKLEDKYQKASDTDSKFPGVQYVWEAAANFEVAIRELNTWGKFFERHKSVRKALLQLRGSSPEPDEEKSDPHTWLCKIRSALLKNPEDKIAQLAGFWADFSIHAMLDDDMNTDEKDNPASTKRANFRALRDKFNWRDIDVEAPRSCPELTREQPKVETPTLPSKGKGRKRVKKESEVVTPAPASKRPRKKTALTPKSTAVAASREPVLSAPPATAPVVSQQEAPGPSNRGEISLVSPGATPEVQEPGQTQLQQQLLFDQILSQCAGNIGAISEQLKLLTQTSSPNLLCNSDNPNLVLLRHYTSKIQKCLDKFPKDDD